MSVASNVATLDASPSPKLVRRREEAIAFLHAQLEKGIGIKSMRIRSGPELDQARAAKLEWTTRASELLNQIFDSPRVAEECNDWVGRIYAEYAEFGNFVEQFYAEMDHRLRRLKAVVRRVEKSDHRPAGEQAPVASASTAAVPIAGEMVASAKVIPITSPTPAQKVRAFLVASPTEEPNAKPVVSFLESLDIEVATSRVEEAAEALEQGSDIGFAIVLDEAAKENEFTLGFCAGRLGIRRVILLHSGTDVPPDHRGLTRLTLDPGGGWMLQLARHLKKVGVDVDLNRLC